MPIAVPAGRGLSWPRTCLGRDGSIVVTSGGFGSGLFAIGRTPGWLAGWLAGWQWQELVQDKEQKIARPKQIYTGIRTRDFVPISER